MMNGTFTNTGRYYDDRWLEQHTSNDKSTITKMQHHYWVTKKTVFRKFGKKEDECIIASDAELDAKLELFHSIQESCLDLQRIIDKYQERLCNLAQEENSMGRFLKEAGKNDKTRAGKMMTAVGKSLSYSGQQRLTLRMPLIRLYQEVETFRHRAIEDTLQNVHSMEKVRTEYRASLSWMKNVSLQLDPDTRKQLERFRKVQGQVRRSKVQFDQLKLDCLQKVDLLAAARCNMFSHALILYQSSLLQFAEKTTKTFTTIASSFKGYQHYEFCVVKELTESSLKLAEQTNGNVGTTQEQEQEHEETDEDKDKLLFFESEYRDDAGTGESSNVIETHLASLGDLLTESSPDMLLDFGFDSVELTKNNDPQSASTNLELLTSSLEECKLFDEILSTEDEGGLGAQWDAMFGVEAKEEDNSFLPCQLYDQYAAARRRTPDASGEPSAESLLSPSPTHTAGTKCAPAPGTSATAKPKGQDKKTWYNLFADLDPLADPDAVGVRAGHDDRNC